MMGGCSLSNGSCLVVEFSCYDCVFEKINNQNELCGGVRGIGKESVGIKMYTGQHILFEIFAVHRKDLHRRMPHTVG